MQLEDYKSKLKEIQADCHKQEQQLMRDYAIANNPYNIGDVFTDHIGSIKVSKIWVHLNNGVPACVYTGRELKKDGSPTKRVLYRDAYQINKLENQRKSCK